jgi:hypothetical protein
MHECELPHVSRSFERDRLRAIFDELSRRDPVGYDIRMFHKLMVVAAWALLALIACATISPIQDRPTLLTSSSFEHLAAFAVLGTLFYLAYPRRIAFVCLIVLGSAVVLELLQQLTPDRHGRIPDALEKIAGGAAGIVAGLVGRIALALLGY